MERASLTAEATGSSLRLHVHGDGAVLVPPGSPQRPGSRRRSAVYLLILLALALMGLLLAGTPASAHMEAIGGLTYNTYSLVWGGADSGQSDLPFNAGWGFYGGFQYWMRPSLAIGAQVDTFSGSGRERWRLGDGGPELGVEVNGQGTGYVATLAAPVATQGSLDVTPFVALGMYSVTADIAFRGEDGDVTARGSLTSASRLGGKLGVTIGREVAPGLAMSGSIAYRLVAPLEDLRTEILGFEREWSLDRGIDVSGLSAGLTVTYSF